MTSHFDQLASELETFKKLSQHGGVNGFLGQEVLRFHSIAGTLLIVENFSLDETASIDERYITHILSRSLLENYFWIIYLFDNPAESNNRYEELKTAFKRDYSKLMNENQLPHKNLLEPADSTWSSLPRSSSLDVNSMLAQVKNDHGDRLNYLYFVYRIASFDTHGKNMGTILEAVFNKKCNFPVLKIKYVFDLIANQYLVILGDLKNRGEV
jgi:hypothetical protein